MRKSGSGIDRINRLSLVVIGLVLVAAGAAGMALGTGLMGSDLAGDSISDTLGQVPTEAELWVGLGAVAAGLLLAYISLRWLLAQFRIPKSAHSLKVETGGRGRTEVKGSAVEHAVSQNLARLPGAKKVRVHLRDNGVEPHLDIRFEVADDADVSDLVRGAGKVLPQAAGLVGRDRLNASIRLVPVPPERVR